MVSRLSPRSDQTKITFVSPGSRLSLIIPIKATSCSEAGVTAWCTFQIGVPWFGLAVPGSSPRPRAFVLRRISTDIGDDPAPDGVDVSLRVDDVELSKRKRMSLFGRTVVDPERQLLR